MGSRTSTPNIPLPNATTSSEASTLIPTPSTSPEEPTTESTILGEDWSTYRIGDNTFELPLLVYDWTEEAIKSLANEPIGDCENSAQYYYILQTELKMLRKFLKKAISNNWIENLDWMFFRVPDRLDDVDSLTSAARDFACISRHYFRIGKKQFNLSFHVHKWAVESATFIIGNTLMESEHLTPAPDTQNAHGTSPSPREESEGSGWRTYYHVWFSGILHFLTMAQEGGWFEKDGWLENFDWYRFPLLEQPDNANDLFLRAVDMMSLDENGRGQEEVVDEHEIWLVTEQ